MFYLQGFSKIEYIIYRIIILLINIVFINHTLKDISRYFYNSN